MLILKQHFIFLLIMSGLSKFTHPKSFPFNGSTFEFFELTYKFIWFIKVQVNNKIKFNWMVIIKALVEIVRKFYQLFYTPSLFGGT